MMKSDDIKELAKALVLLQSKVRDVEKDKQGYGYKYADLQQMLEISRPLAAEHGLAIIQHPTSNGELVGLNVMVLHDTGQWLQWDVTAPIERGKSKMSFAQEIGCMVTYLRKYSLAGICGFTQKDDDGKPTENHSTVTYERCKPVGSVFSERLEHLLSLLPPEEEQNARVWYKNQGFTEEAQTKMLNKLEARFNKPVLEEGDVQGL